MSESSHFTSNYFQKEILIEELLSLGHPKLGRQISHQIGLSIENYLDRNRIDSPTAELLHELIDHQMKKIGFIPLTRHLPTMGLKSSPPKNKTEEKLHGNHEEENGIDEIPPEILNILSNQRVTIKTEEKLVSKKSYQLEHRTLKLPESGRKFINEYCALHGEQGQLLEKPEDFFLRLSKYVAGFEKKYDPTIIHNDFNDIFYDLMASRRFMPHTSILMNFDRSGKNLISDYHIPLEHHQDTDTAKFLTQLIELEQDGGKVSFDISGFYATSEHKIGAKQILSYLEESLELFSKSAQTHVKHQAFLSIHHPEIVSILEYITSQDKPLRIIPIIGISHQFMKAIERDKSYPLIDPVQRQFVGQIDAYKIYRLLAHAIRKSGNAQIVFLERMNEIESIYRMPVKLIPTLDGSQFLKPYDVGGINGHINLAEHVEDYEIDWEKLKLTIFQGIHFLDNLIDGIMLPILECQEHLQSFRRVGLGITGFIEMSEKLGIEENERKVVETFSEVVNFIKSESLQATSLLAQRKSSMKGLNQTCLNPNHPRRNSHILANHFDPYIHKIFNQKQGFSSLNKQGLELKLTSILQNHFKSGVMHNLSSEIFSKEASLMQFIMQNYQHQLCAVSFVKPVFHDHHNLKPKSHLEKSLWEQKELFNSDQVFSSLENKENNYFFSKK